MTMGPGSNTHTLDKNIKTDKTYFSQKRKDNTLSHIQYQSKISPKTNITAFQLLFTPIGYPGWRLFALGKRASFAQLWLSMYTAPAYMACTMNIVGALSIRYCFREHYAGLLLVDASPATTTTSTPSSSNKVWVAFCFGLNTIFTQEPNPQFGFDSA